MTWTLTQSRRGLNRTAWIVEFLRLAFILDAFLYFMLPGAMLIQFGWEYLGGGPAYQKIYVATYLLVFVFALMFILDRRLRDTAISLFFKELTFIIFVVSIATTALFAIVAKEELIAPFVDTFLVALIATIGFVCVPARYLRAFKYLLDAYFVANIAIVFIEYLSKSYLVIPNRYVAYHTGLFRAAGFFETPLSAALLLGLYFLVLLTSTSICFRVSCLSRLMLAFASLSAIQRLEGAQRW